jgi:hypothetical protein
MRRYAELAKENDAEPTLLVVESGLTLQLTCEEAHELFERTLNSTLEDTPASAQALKKLANAIGTASS